MQLEVYTFHHLPPLPPLPTLPADVLIPLFDCGLNEALLQSGSCFPKFNKMLKLDQMRSEPHWS